MPTSTLKHFVIRDIRQGAVDELVERFEKGYNPSKPLTVVKKDGELLVANGNHRLRALNEAGIDEVPCVIYTDVDPYKLAVEGNADEDTYSPMDLFDWIEVIESMKEEGYTQQVIGERIGWTREKVAGYSRISENIVGAVLEKTKSHQKGRPTEDVGIPTYNFNETWFRNLYGIEEYYQRQLVEDFIADKCNWNSNKVKSEAAKYKRWQEFIQTAEGRLVNQDDLDELTELLSDESMSERDINNALYSYSLFYKPTIKMFQDININRYGLKENEYLTDFINEKGQQSMRSITNRLLSVLESLENVTNDIKDDYTREQLETHISELKGIESDIYTNNHDGISKFKRHIEATGNYEDVEIISHSKENDFFTIIYKDDAKTIKERYSYLQETDSFMMFENITY